MITLNAILKSKPGCAEQLAQALAEIGESAVVAATTHRWAAPVLVPNSRARGRKHFG